ncbi:prolyl oligopeptidase family serine peptidase [Dyella sp. EPa41]|uniref:alpha/beta hydrolase family protein n=1 Tax=Dyella sp. EPa41 TaxID=1561194 RepID=UPI001916C858|nr:prolyl oligopeptidase family serine peptidase [Dyella sp. EPa41]
MRDVPVPTTPWITRFATLPLLLLGLSLAVPHPAQASVETQLCAAALPTAGVEVHRTTLAGVPAIVRVPKRVSRPPIVLWHGFGPPASEAAMMEALPLDDVDAVKVYLGLPLFGDRALPGGMKELAQRQGKDVGLQVFKPVVAGAGDELPGVVHALEEQGCLRPREAIGLVGFSAGGAAALYAMSRHAVAVNTAVFINPSMGLTASVQAFEQATGHTYAWSPASRELAKQTDAVDHVDQIAGGTPPPALLFLRGADDPVIDAHALDDLGARLRPLYRAHAQRLQFTRLPGVSHQWASDPQGLASVRLAVARWFIAH